MNSAFLFRNIFLSRRSFSNTAFLSRRSLSASYVRSFSVAAPPSLPGRDVEESKKVLPKLSLLERIKAEMAHYGNGAKLFALETRESFGILLKNIRGEKLVRREQLQLARTTQDFVRLIPFSVFIIVPFLELLLPFAIKLFPNLLPSTFEGKSQMEQRKQRAEASQLAAAQSIQEESVGKFHPKLDDLFKAYHLSGQSISTDDFVEVALSVPSTSIESLSRPQIVLLCQYMGLSTKGPLIYLQSQLRNALSRLMADDELIESEGIDSLSDEDLYMACYARGIKVFNVSKDVLQSDLQQWIDLHFHRKFDPLLLVTTRALIMNARAKLVENPVSTEEPQELKKK